MKKLRTLIGFTMLIMVFSLLSACQLAQTDDSGDEASLEETLERDFTIGFVLYLDSEDAYDPNAVNDLETLRQSTELFFMAHESENDDGFSHTAVEKGSGLECDGTDLKTGGMEVGDTTVETLEISEDFTFYYGPELVGEIVSVYAVKEHGGTQEVNLQLLERFHIDELGGMSASLSDTHEIDERPFYETDFTIDFVSAPTLDDVSLRVMDETHALIETIEVDLDDPEDVTIHEGAYVILEEHFEDSVERTLFNDDATYQLKIINESGYADIVPLNIAME
ncbi:MAG: hypothetical protein ACOCU0_00975 [Bacillota bacterium]